MQVTYLSCPPSITPLGRRILSRIYGARLLIKANSRSWFRARFDCRWSRKFMPTERGPLEHSIFRNWLRKCWDCRWLKYEFWSFGRCLSIIITVGEMVYLGGNGGRLGSWGPERSYGDGTDGDSPLFSQLHSVLGILTGHMFAHIPARFSLLFDACTVVRRGEFMEQNVRLMKKIFPLEFSIFNIKYNSLIIIINGIVSQWKKIFYSLFLLLKNIFIVIFSSCRRLCI